MLGAELGVEQNVRVPSIREHSLEIARLDIPSLSVSQRSLVRPVSRVRFDVTDRTAFEKCVALAVEWMGEAPRRGQRPRSGIPLPSEAARGESFDVSDVLGANPAKALRLKASDGTLWAARLDFPDPDYPRSWVSEFFCGTAYRTTGQVRRAAYLRNAERVPAFRAYKAAARAAHSRIVVL